jgi:Skp family chaperone for outer membrane proteins
MTAPIWFLAVQLLLTIAIGVLAAVIGFMQWRTAHQKVALDLFERRFAVIQQARNVMGRVASARKAGSDEIRDMHKAVIDSEFLFGPMCLGFFRRVLAC